jgi:hypothetical protein
MVAPDGGVVALAALVRSAAFYRHKAIVFDAFFAPSPSLLGIRTFGIVAAHPPPAAQHLGLSSPMVSIRSKAVDRCGAKTRRNDRDHPSIPRLLLD